LEKFSPGWWSLFCCFAGLFEGGFEKSGCFDVVFCWLERGECVVKRGGLMALK
jgi:hypothetical protein